MKNQIWNNVIHILAGITLGFLMFGCKSSKDGCDAYSLKWTKEADSLIVYKDHEIFIPQTPASNAKQIHFNNVDKGKYIVNLLKDGEVIETKKLDINK
jgi:hypothetical protein